MGKGRREHEEREGEIDTGRCPEGGQGEREEGDIDIGRCREGERTWGEGEIRDRY